MSTAETRFLQKRKVTSSKFILIVSLVVLGYYTLIGIWPFVYNVFISFRKTDLLTVNRFIGLSNYRFLIKDPVFWQSLWQNMFYLVVMVFLGIVTSLIFAGLINKTKGIMKKIYTAMFFAPVVTSMVAVSLVWSLLYYPKVGVFASFLSGILGMSRDNFIFLQNPSSALFWIIIVDVWRDSGIKTVIFLAGMDEIPDSLYETAQIDGAGNLRQFFKITVPLLRPQLIFVAAVYSINAIVRIYVYIYMMTGSPPGGPANSTMILQLHMYLSAFYGQQFGYGASIAMVMFVILIGLVVMEVRSFQQKWEY